MNCQTDITGSRAWRYAIRCVLGLLLLFSPALAPAAKAHITKIEIDRTKCESPAFGGKTFGTIGQYEKIVGLAYGELDPNDRHNSIIQDIKLAPRNSRGMVEYVATFSLSKPLDMSKASGVLIYDVVNRGNETVPGTFRFGTESGDEFFAARGVMILRSGWQGDLSPNGRGGWGGKAYSIQLPIAKNPDGSSITGQVLGRFADMPPNTNTLPLTAVLPGMALTYERP